MVTHQSKKSIINRVRQNLEKPHLPESIETVEDIMFFLDDYKIYIEKLETAILDKGREQGIEKRNFEIVEKMFENNMSAADIRKITGLSLAKIEQIRKKLKKK